MYAELQGTSEMFLATGLAIEKERQHIVAMSGPNTDRVEAGWNVKFQGTEILTYGWSDGAGLWISIRNDGVIVVDGNREDIPWDKIDFCDTSPLDLAVLTFTDRESWHPFYNKTTAPENQDYQKLVAVMAEHIKQFYAKHRPNHRISVLKSAILDAVEQTVVSN